MSLINKILNYDISFMDLDPFSGPYTNNLMSKSVKITVSVFLVKLLVTRVGGSTRWIRSHRNCEDIPSTHFLPSLNSRRFPV